MHRQVKTGLFPGDASSGMGIIQVMIVSALFMAIILGVSNMMAGLYKSVNTMNARSSLRNIKSNIENLALGNASWRRTLADAARNPSMDCLRNNTVCNSGVANPLVLIDGDDNIFFDGSAVPDPLVGTGIPGFTSTGQPCNTFDADNGNNQCPFTYRLAWTAECPGAAASCLIPTVRITAALFQSSPLDSMSLMQMNNGKFSVDVTRGMGTMNQPVVLRYLSTVGEGVCNGGDRQLNEEISDIGNNASFISATVFRLVGGTYSCQISAPGYHVGLFKISLRAPALALTMGQSSSAQSDSSGGEATATIFTAFTLPTDTNLSISQECTGTTGTANDLGNVGLNRTLTLVNCIRIN